MTDRLDAAWMDLTFALCLVKACASKSPSNEVAPAVSADFASGLKERP